MLIKNNESAFNLTTMNANFINLDLDLVLANEGFLQYWSSFDEDLSNNPRYVLDCVGLAFYEVFFIVFLMFHYLMFMNNT